MIDRRGFLRWSVALAVTSALPWRAATAAATRRAGCTFFVPGNYQDGLYFEGVPAHTHPRFARAARPFKGHPTIVTRLHEPDRSVTRAILPVAGHDITVKHDGSTAVCNGQSATTMCTFDPVTLDMGTFFEYPASTLGGGHSVYLPDDRNMVVAERVPYERFTGTIEEHYGSLAIRDNETLKLVEKFSCGGIMPHQVVLLKDGKHVAVCNYGATNWPKGSAGYDHYIVEPSLCVIEMASGKILDRYVSEKPTAEYRHLAALDRRRIFVMQNSEMSLAAFNEAMKDTAKPYQAKLQSSPFTVGSSDPVLQLDFEAAGSPATLRSTPKPSEMLRGQSIVYDPATDQAIGTFPQSDTVVAISGKTGKTRVVNTFALGLESPRGIAMHPDGVHYVVAGDDGPIFVFECATHRMVPERTFYEKLYRHSHMTAA